MNMAVRKALFFVRSGPALRYVHSDNRIRYTASIVKETCPFLKRNIFSTEDNTNGFQRGMLSTVKALYCRILRDIHTTLHVIPCL